MPYLVSSNDLPVWFQVYLQFSFFFPTFFSKLCLWILSLELELNITRIISYLATLSRSRFILHIPQLESNHFTFKISFILFRKWDLVAFFFFFGSGKTQLQINWHIIYCRHQVFLHPHYNENWQTNGPLFETQHLSIINSVFIR